MPWQVVDADDVSNLVVVEAFTVDFEEKPIKAVSYTNMPLPTNR